MTPQRQSLHSKFVGGLKILLPLAALAILSSVVFFARENEDAREIPFLMSGGPDTPDERMEAPEYQGVTSDGSQLKLNAAEVTPATDENWFDISDVAGRVETPSGRVFQATSPDGRVNFVDDRAELIGVVSVDTSDGFHVLSEDLYTRLDVTFGRSGGAIRGDAPFGTLEAGGMRFRYEEVGGQLLVFNGGVKLIYQPHNQ